MSLRFRDISIIFGILSLFLAMGCRDDIKWCESRKIPAEGWLSGEIIEFNLDPAAYQPNPENRFAEMTARAMGDTLPRCLGTYQAVLAFRYVDKCNVSRLDLILEKAGLDEPISTDTLRIPLFLPDGTPIGKGRFGIFETSIVVPDFKVSNGTLLSLRPATEADTIRGLSDVTLLLTQKGHPQKTQK